MDGRRQLRSHDSGDSDVQYIPPSQSLRSPAFDLDKIMKEGHAPGRAVRPPSTTPRPSGSGASSSTPAPTLLPSRFNDSDESSPHDGQKKKDNKDKDKKNKKEKTEKKTKGKKKNKNDDEEDEDVDAEHAALGGGNGEDDDDDDDLFGDLEGLEDLVDEEGGDGGKKMKKRPAASKKERELKKRPAKKRDDGVEAEGPKPWQYMIEDAATYSSYRSQSLGLEDSLQMEPMPPPKLDWVYPDNQEGLSPEKVDAADTLMDSDHESPKDTLGFHRGLAHEDLTEVLDQVQDQDLTHETAKLDNIYHDDVPMSPKESSVNDNDLLMTPAASLVDGYDDDALTVPEEHSVNDNDNDVPVTPKKLFVESESVESPLENFRQTPTHGDRKKSPSSTPSVLKATSKAKAKSTKAKSTKAKSTNAKSTKIKASAKKAPIKNTSTSAGSKQKAGPRAKAVAQPKSKAKATDKGKARPVQRKVKDAIEKKMHSVYSVAHTFAKVAHSPKSAKRIASEARKEWILKEGHGEHASAKKFLALSGA